MSPSDTNKENFYCGTSNIELPVPSKQYFPTEYKNKSRLNYYASLFNSVEINSTFYKIPMPRTVEKWADDVPEYFRFTFKLWQGITHAKQLHYAPNDVDRFMKTISMAGSKKGCVLIQFPASIKVSNLQRIEELLSQIFSIESTAGWNISVEFRDRSWYADGVYTVLEQYGVNLVIHDMPASATPTIAFKDGCVYFRFHGKRGDYKGTYTDEHLMTCAMQIRDWINAGNEVFAYFNNTLGLAVQNAATLNGFYGSLINK